MNLKIQRQFVFALVFSFIFAGTTFASEVNPFDDVPANHWAYESISKLVQAGIINGYSDGKIFTRYEMAAVVGKAMSNAKKPNTHLTSETKSELTKLENEFVTELKNMGVRVTQSEQDTSGIKFGGTVRIRYQQNPLLTATNKNSTTPTRTQERLAINMKAKVSENVAFYGDMMEETKFNNRAVDGPKAGIATSNNPQSFLVDRAELLWKHDNTSVSLGRFYTTLGQGLIWSGGTGNGLDGVYGTYNFNDKWELSAGYADMDATICTGSSINARLANLKYQVSDNASITVANLKVLNHPIVNYAPQIAAVGTLAIPYYFDQLAIGGKYAIGDWTVTAETIRNNADGLPSNAQRNGFDVKVQWKKTNNKIPGTYSIMAEYLQLGNWATDSNWWKVNLFTPGGNYIGGDGAKGFGLDYHYIISRGLDFNLKYYRLKPYSTSASNFSSYKPFFSIVTNWSF